ncbi:riboflavin kinase / FMN adenylyltransferase [Caminicella sporogenes DSM 14501]|uniref:Riboflavin biosynthesis protein n=1 Tax=Caminicella sporogenes DSM 14501 TaxID=1121266 RepID=A0A1M6L7N2_9FIRM|nr:bifunctional riboflavin kinase/FAD synthetase [Caminicella sporogenes]RKD27737.1 riboflavin biosynthesis protein RibF [Caminicella sporogenes]SHJ67258.1 riboflavin kinase / FMN adenylyltransferase [Caminicella sporogenes DSM 14501]
MELISSLNDIKKLDCKSCISIGTFDGLHKGHQILIENLINLSKNKKNKSIVYTFANHPKELTNKNCFPKKIVTNADKIKLFEKMGVDILLLLNFDEFHKNTYAEDFVRDILINRLNMEAIIVGYDFRFGKNAEGSSELLKKLSKKYNFDINVVMPIKIDNEIVSSTLIRKFLSEGQVEKANNFLGWKYFLRGKVIRGRQLGSKLGFPTANILVDSKLCLPKTGVYITKTYIDNKSYYSITNIGFKPTFNENSYSIETYIINFSENIYDKEIKVEFHKRIRDEMKFDTVKLLCNQIECDIYSVKNFFKII